MNHAYMYPYAYYVHVYIFRYLLLSKKHAQEYIYTRTTSRLPVSWDHTADHPVHIYRRHCRMAPHCQTYECCNRNSSAIIGCSSRLSRMTRDHPRLPVVARPCGTTFATCRSTHSRLPVCCRRQPKNDSYDQVATEKSHV